MKGQMLSGTTTGQDGTPWTWTGRRAPSLKRAGTPKVGQAHQIVQWQRPYGMEAGQAESRERVESRERQSRQPRPRPRADQQSKFEDFKLHVEFNCGEKSNSGVYLRGRYEVQIETNSEQEPPSHHTGGVYGFLAPSPELPRKAGEWQTFDITLVGRTVTVVQNGQTIIDHKEIPGITGGALDSHEGVPGPIYLQGSEDGHITFRNIVITPAMK